MRYCLIMRINRYIMECKFSKKYRLTPVLLELIDTLWNVNTNIMYKKEDIHTELIDTLWNVNMKLLLVLLVAKQRINRYIMECKYLMAKGATLANTN